MSTNPPDPRQQYSSTYFVEDRSNQDEMTRLTIQDRMLTIGMGILAAILNYPINDREIVRPAARAIV